MIILLLLSLVAASLTGLKAYGVEGHGPLAQFESGDSSAHAELSQKQMHTDRYFYHDDDEEGEEEHEDDDDHRYYSERESEHGEMDENETEEFWEEIHEASVNFTLLLVFIHVIGVVVSSRLHGQNLVGAMITGRKAQAG